MNKSDTTLVTCDKCPKRDTCTSLCGDMTVILSRVEATHSSPRGLEGGSSAAVNIPAMDDTAMMDDGFNREFVTLREHANIRRLIQQGKLSNVYTPSHEQTLLRNEREAAVKTVILHRISAYITSLRYKKPEQSAQVESLLVLHFLDGYAPGRVCEILGERYPYFAQTEKHPRKSIRGVACEPGRTITVKTGLRVVSYHIRKFNQFVRATHLGQAIRKILQTGSMEQFFEVI